MIRVGLLYGLFTVILIQLLKLDEMSFRELFLSKLFLVKLLIFMVIRVFGFEYAMWLFSEIKYRKLTSQENT